MVLFWSMLSPSYSLVDASTKLSRSNVLQVSSISHNKGVNISRTPDDSSISNYSILS